ncbi:MAG TPA: prepilin-type N-terminal cleavage/methylation domain-containing protein [Candidatus Paceibacterota bacterium]|jgi:prepilin-type N-terminal cleavage/methylation domain
MGKKGFTLIELLVVIAIIGLLSSIVLASLNTARIKSRDAARLSALRQVQIALEYYYDKHGRYPDPSSDSGGYSCSGWDGTVDGSFIPALAADGFLNTIHDPNHDSNCGNLAYYRYTAGSYACSASRGAYYVLGVRDMEGSSGTHSKSPGWSCPDRDWQSEFEWVMGKFEN